jgi:hypothetical protein
MTKLTSLRKQIAGKDIRDRTANIMLSYLDRDVHENVFGIIYNKMQFNVTVRWNTGITVSAKINKSQETNSW